MSFITISERSAGTAFSLSAGGVGFLAMWQCTHSNGSAAVNGRIPVSIR